MPATVECHAVKRGLTLTASLFLDGPGDAVAVGIDVTADPDRDLTYTFQTTVTGLKQIYLLNGSTELWTGWADIPASGTISASDTREGALAGTPMQADADERNRIADHVLRRSQANVEASADGDALDLHSVYGLIEQAQKSGPVVGGSMPVYKRDGVTLLGTLTFASDPDAAPVTGVS